MLAMQRETLQTILRRAAGLQQDGERYRVKEDHELTVYFGQPGRAVAIEHVLSLVLADTHIEIEARDRGTFFADYGIVHALLHSPRKDRKGAAGVGF
jgi:hypothetical protein